MYYSININQIAIANHNQNFGTNLDLIDGAIIEYLAKQSTSTFAKTNFLVYNKEVYYRICYDNIISQLPLINIENKEVIGRRIKKLEKADIVKFYIDKKSNNKTYFTTTELFENFVSRVPTQKSIAPDSKVDTHPTQKSNHIYDNNINDNNTIYNINTASGFSQSENPISRKNGKIEIKTSEYGKTQILCPCGEELLDETLEPDKYFCSECLSMYSKDEVLKIIGVNENSVVNDSFTTQNPTVKKSLTVQKPKKEEEVLKKNDIENFVRNFKASEFEVDGVIQFQSIFSENEIHLITKWILRRKETHKSKVKNTEQAITGVLNDILDIKKEIPLETIFEQRDGCYVNCGASGDASKTHQSIKLEYFTKLIKKPTFNNQYAKQSNGTPTARDLLKRYEEGSKTLDPRRPIE